MTRHKYHVRWHNFHFKWMLITVLGQKTLVNNHQICFKKKKSEAKKYIQCCDLLIDWFLLSSNLGSKRSSTGSEIVYISDSKLCQGFFHRGQIREMNREENSAFSPPPHKSVYNRGRGAEYLIITKERQ